MHLTNFECFCLRLLLHIVRGPTFFDDLRVVDGQMCCSFKEACSLRGLLEDGAHWKETLEQAAVSHSPVKLRNLFAVMIVSCGLGNPMQLWTEQRESLAEDVPNRARQENPGLNITYTDAMFNQALILLEDKVMELSGHNLAFYGLTSPLREMVAGLSREVLQETNFDHGQLSLYIDQNEPLLVDDQRRAYLSVLIKVQSCSGSIVFLDAPGGMGKTFVINLLLAKMIRDGHIAVGVASLGIAAVL